MTSHIHIDEPVIVNIGIVVSRPSRIIKTPYVCDYLLEDEDIDNTSVLAHTPSLGCNGMVDKGSSVIAVKRRSDGKKQTKCDYSVIASIRKENDTTYIVGVDPSIAERFAGELLTKGVIDGLCLKQNTLLQSQKTYCDCRFDYCGITDKNEPFICEIKNISIAEYEDLHPKLLCKKDFSDYDINSKIALFPSGYKPKGRTHSERALKHTRTLMEIKRANPEMRCVILFVVQRADVRVFQPCRGDEQYYTTLKNACETGVEVYAVSIEWCYDETAKTLTPKISNPSLPVSI